MSGVAQATDEAPWFQRYLDRLPREARVLELGCGSGEDASALAALGRDVVATDIRPAALAEAATRLGTRALIRVDHARGLPFRDGAFGVVIASLSLHYFSWASTLAAFTATRRVLGQAGVLLFRVNATDDVHFGALEGDEIEPHYRTSERSEYYGGRKRFFDEADVRAALGGAFRIEHLEHVELGRWRRPKQTWECLAIRLG
ncbi:MAG: class I SAM-dependent methyltransferase [Dehalococcoidia bacterium]|nr:class I SAM-dependent methyltransferase [Dehalococcoidia bacterium]